MVATRVIPELTSWNSAWASWVIVLMPPPWASSFTKLRHPSFPRPEDSASAFHLDSFRFYEDLRPPPAHPPEAISLFGADHLAEVDSLVRDAQPAERRRRARILDDIRPSDGLINLSAFRSLMMAANLQCSAWVRRFIFGFPPIGALCQRYTFLLGPEVSESVPWPPADLSGAGRDRFDERAKKAGRKNLKAPG